MLSASSFGAVFITTCLFIVGNTLLKPALASLLSKRTAEGQGMTMGLSNSFMSLGRIIGPLWAGTALDMNLSLPYLTGAIIMAVGFLTTFVWLYGSSGREIPAPALES
jgi:MFS transporter, DHA1 family, multidrug resistance protein